MIICEAGCSWRPLTIDKLIKWEPETNHKNPYVHLGAQFSGIATGATLFQVGAPHGESVTTHGDACIQAVDVEGKPIKPLVVICILIDNSIILLV